MKSRVISYNHDIVPYSSYWSQRNKALKSRNLDLYLMCTYVHYALQILTLLFGFWCDMSSFDSLTRLGLGSASSANYISPSCIILAHTTNRVMQTGKVVHFRRGSFICLSSQISFAKLEVRANSPGSQLKHDQDLSVWLLIDLSLFIQYSQAVVITMFHWHHMHINTCRS